MNADSACRHSVIPGEKNWDKICALFLHGKKRAGIQGMAGLCQNCGCIMTATDTQLSLMRLVYICCYAALWIVWGAAQSYLAYGVVLVLVLLCGVLIRFMESVILVMIPWKACTAVLEYASAPMERLLEDERRHNIRKHILLTLLTLYLLTIVLRR